MPTDPGPSRWALPDPGLAPGGEEVLGVGADLAAATLLSGFRSGLFPMPHGRRLAWFSPDPRGVLPLARFHVSRSLRRSSRAFGVSVDRAFEGVLAGCSDPGRSGAQWITRPYRAGYRELHDLGWAHSVEIWRGDALVGGVLGVEIGGLFCGESMFHRDTDASKAALWATVATLSAADAAERVFDVQWLTPHLASLGAIEVPRATYLAALPAALRCRPLIRPAPLMALPEYLRRHPAMGATAPPG